MSLPTATAGCDSATNSVSKIRFSFGRTLCGARDVSLFFFVMAETRFQKALCFALLVAADTFFVVILLPLLHSAAVVILDVLTRSCSSGRFFMRAREVFWNLEVGFSCGNFAVFERS